MNVCTVKDIIDCLREWAPEEWAEDFDNPGMTVGSEAAQVKGIYLALDANKRSVRKAVESHCNLMITHHPLFIANAVKSFVQREVWEDEQTALFCAQNDVTLYTAHTNLDCAAGGVNDVLCAKLGWKDSVPVPDIIDGHPGIGRRCVLPEEMTLAETGKHVMRKLENDGIEIIGDPEKKIHSAFLCGGSGGSFLKEAKTFGCDVLITGEAKHHERVFALDNDIAIIVAGHYETEYWVLDAVKDALQKHLNHLEYDIPIVIEEKQMVTRRLVF